MDLKFEWDLLETDLKIGFQPGLNEIIKDLETSLTLTQDRFKEGDTDDENVKYSEKEISSYTREELKDALLQKDKDFHELRNGMIDTILENEESAVDNVREYLLEIPGTLKGYLDNFKDKLLKEIK